ncbi:MAG TPA: ABC transporter substrate-binding protein [Xanthobacteraceae bacterium]
MRMQYNQLKRRQVIALLAGAMTAWPPAARSQQSPRMHRVGILMNLASQDPEGQMRVGAFLGALAERGWTDTHNVTIDTCWGAGDAGRFRRCAAELVALTPDVILAGSAAATGPLLAETRVIPIVFVQTPDPVGAGYVTSLAHPGGNATGFTQFEYGMAGKWLELIKTVQPGLKRVMVLRDLDSTGFGQLGAIALAAKSFGTEVRPLGVDDAREMETAVTEFAQSPDGGLIVTGNAPAAVHRDLIVTLAARHRLPAVYPFRYFAKSGGLMSYGPNTIEPYRRAAEYVHRILHGEKPADLPVQAGTRYDLVINLGTAKSLGITIPDTLLALADEVIE